MSADQKATATRGILMQAAAVGGLMILGVGISTRLARVSQAKNWNEIEGLIGKNLNEVELPPGYATRQKNGRTEITRINANETEFAPLSVSDEGVIQLGGADNRISNANTMNNNYLKALRERMAVRFGTQNADRLTKEINSLVTKHHILPDNVLQKTDLGRRALIAGYNLDADINTIGLAKSTANQARLRQLGEATPNQPGHWTSHSEYDKAVTAELNQLKKDLERDYGKPLGEIPDAVILKEMKNLENEFRQNIKDGQVPIKDGRIAFVPPTGARSETRV